jgi:DUF1680 family protein
MPSCTRSPATPAGCAPPSGCATSAFVDPLIARRDALAGLHANTQIPKAIGLARFYETSGKSEYGDAASFFHQTVVDHHSYVLGGNSEREHFGPADNSGIA